MEKRKLIPFREIYDALPEKRRREIEKRVEYRLALYALRDRRKQLGLSQEDISKITKIPRVTINRIESGTRNVTLKNLLSITEALKMDLRFVEKEGESSGG